MPIPGAWDEEDEFYRSDQHWGARYVRPPRREYLAPQGPSGTRADVSYGLHRSRSQGHNPAPNVTIYNTVDADQQPYISNSPSGRPTSRGRPRASEDWAIEDQLAEMRLEMARQRSRSRGPVDHFHEHHRSASHSPNYEKRVELELAKERLRLKEEELERERLEEQYKREYDLRREREARKRAEREAEDEAEKKRIIAENTMKLERAEQEQKAARQRAVDDWSRKKAEQDKAEKELRQKAVDDFNKKKAEEEAERKAERQRAVDEFERKKREKQDEEKDAKQKIIDEYEAKRTSDAKKQKEMEEALIAKLKQQEEEKKEKEKKDWEDFIAKQKAKEAEEKAKKEAADKEFEQKMAERLMQSGFQFNQIQAITKPEKQPNLAPGFLPNNPIQAPVGHQPTYIKVHRDHLSIDTLTYFNVPWRYDEHDHSYFIILREMDNIETDMLFEHTRRMRTRTTSSLLIEERDHRGGKPEYAFVRHKSKSRAVSPSPNRRRKSSPKRVGLRLF